MTTGNQQTQTTTPEGVIAALDELLKSTGATDVRKRLDTLRKGGIENSGVMVNGKEQGGGQASGSDEGSIETLMIAKMTSLGIPSAKQGAMLGFLKGLMGKAEGEEPEEEPEDEGEGGGDDEGDDDDTAGMSAEAKAAYLKGRASVGLRSDEGVTASYNKSQTAADRELEALAKSGAMASRFRENTQLSEDMDAAPFLSALVHEVTAGFDALAKSFAGARAKDQKLIKSLGKVVGHLAVDNMEQKRVITALGERLGLVERTPMPQRGVTHASGAKPLVKSLGNAGGQPEQLSKAEVLSTLTYMNLQKGQKQINGFRTVDLVTDAEAADVIDQGTLKAVYDFHRENPNESEAARTF